MSHLHNLLVDAYFVSEWGDGSLIQTDCKIDLETGKVKDIEISGADPDGGLCREFVLVGEEEFDINNEDRIFLSEGELERLRSHIGLPSNGPCCSSLSHPGF